MEQGGEVILRLVRGRQSTIDGALVAVVPDVWSAILSLDGGRRRNYKSQNHVVIPANLAEETSEKKSGGR